MQNLTIENFKALTITEKLALVGGSILTKNQIILLDELCYCDEVSTAVLSDDLQKSKGSIARTASSLNKKYEDVNNSCELIFVESWNGETTLLLDQDELNSWLDGAFTNVEVTTEALAKLQAKAEDTPAEETTQAQVNTVFCQMQMALINHDDWKTNYVAILDTLNTFTNDSGVYIDARKMIIDQIEGTL